MKAKVFQPPHFRNYPMWKDISEEEWRDWRWQIKNRITSIAQIEKAVQLTEGEREGIKKLKGYFRTSITPYFFTLVDPHNSACPVRMQVIPTLNELAVAPADLVDPLCEDTHRPVKHIVHRYPDRVLFLAFDQCFIHCRHCTRRRLVGTSEIYFDRADFKEAIQYLKDHSEIRDVVISGGDPLVLSTDKLEFIIKTIREISHIEIIRVGTRAPVVCPMRIDQVLISMLKKYHPIYICTHFNHPKELTEEARHACTALVDAGFPIRNQTVLLRGVNSSALTLRCLFQELLKVRVDPYYLYQCDLAKGIEHFRTPVKKGIEIIESLRGHTTGFAVPTYVIDAPGGGGKIPIAPKYLVKQEGHVLTLRNYEGKKYRYTEPGETDCSCPYEETFFGKDLMLKDSASQDLPKHL